MLKEKAEQSDLYASPLKVRPGSTMDSISHAWCSYTIKSKEQFDTWCESQEDSVKNISIFDSSFEFIASFIHPQ